jgi:hypothetical protein
LGLGTAINVAAVLVGGGIGTLAGANLPEGVRATAMQAIGIVTLLVGVANFLDYGNPWCRSSAWSRGSSSGSWWG